MICVCSTYTVCVVHLKLIFYCMKYAHLILTHIYQVLCENSLIHFGVVSTEMYG